MKRPIALLVALLLAAGTYTITEVHAQSTSGPIPHDFKIDDWDVKCWGYGRPLIYNCSMSRNLTDFGLLNIYFYDDHIMINFPKCKTYNIREDQKISRHEEIDNLSLEIYRPLYSVAANCDSTYLRELDGTRNIIGLLLRATS